MTKFEKTIKTKRSVYVEGGELQRFYIQKTRKNSIN